MDFNKFKEVAKSKGVKVGFLTKGLYRIVADNISDEETIHDIAEAFDKKSSNLAPVVVTDRSIYIISYASMMGGMEQKVIPLANVTSVASGGKVLLKSLMIYEGTTEHVVERMGPKADQLIKTINDLKNKAATAQSTPAASSGSSADEIRKMKQLLDDGILSQEEFDAKKKQLLGL